MQGDHLGGWVLWVTTWAQGLGKAKTLKLINGVILTKLLNL